MTLVEPTITSQRLRARMDELSINQSELARRVGCTREAVVHLLNGRAKHSKFLPSVANELKLPLRYLMGETDDPHGASPEQTLTGEERKWLDLLHQLEPVDRKTLVTLIESLISRGKAPR